MTILKPHLQEPVAFSGFIIVTKAQDSPQNK